MPNINIIELYLKTLQSPKTRYFLLFFTFAYIISPIDLIPDFFFPFGEIDDGILILLLLYGIIVSVIERIKTKQNSKLKK